MAKVEEKQILNHHHRSPHIMVTPAPNRAIQTNVVNVVSEGNRAREREGGRESMCCKSFFHAARGTANWLS